jgi:hypothetical protein
VRAGSRFSGHGSRFFDGAFDASGVFRHGASRFSERLTTDYSFQKTTFSLVIERAVLGEREMHRREPRMQHLDQKALATRWLISPRTLEQWR